MKPAAAKESLLHIYAGFLYSENFSVTAAGMHQKLIFHVIFAPVSIL